MFVTSQKKHLFFCVALYENFAVDQKASIFGGYVVKEFAYAFSGQPYQEGRVPLGITLTHPSGSPNFPRASITQYTYTKHEQILNSGMRNRIRIWYHCQS